MTLEKARITSVKMAGKDHAVIRTETAGGTELYRRTPCAECPWRRDNAGSFPAEAFVHSASTAYDQADSTFGCHMTPKEYPSTCAGFLLRNSENNLMVRVRQANGRLNLSKVSDDGADLFDSYREMAVANGVDAEHEALAPCRDDEGWRRNAGQ